MHWGTILLSSSSRIPAAPFWQHCFSSKVLSGECGSRVKNGKGREWNFQCSDYGWLIYEVIIGQSRWGILVNDYSELKPTSSWLILVMQVFKREMWTRWQAGQESLEFREENNTKGWNFLSYPHNNFWFIFPLFKTGETWVEDVTNWFSLSAVDQKLQISSALFQSPHSYMLSICKESPQITGTCHVLKQRKSKMFLGRKKNELAVHHFSCLAWLL